MSKSDEYSCPKERTDNRTIQSLITLYLIIFVVTFIEYRIGIITKRLLEKNQFQTRQSICHLNFNTYSVTCRIYTNI